MFTRPRRSCRRSGRSPLVAAAVGVADRRRSATSRRPRPRRGFPGHGARRQRHGHGRDPADGDRVAVADGDRDALRHRRRQPGQGGRPEFDYPPSAPHTQLDGNNPNVEAIAVVQARPGGGVRRAPQRRTRSCRALGHPGPRATPAATNLSRSTRSSTSSGKADRARGAGDAPRWPRSSARSRASWPRSTSRARPQTYYYELDQTYYSATSSTFIGQVLGLLGLHSIADAAKGAAASGGLPAAERRVHPEVQPRLHPPGRHDLLRPVGGHRGARPGWSESRRGEGRAGAGLNDDIASRWGPRIVVLLSEVAAEMKAHPVGGNSS